MRQRGRAANQGDNQPPTVWDFLWVPYKDSLKIAAFPSSLKMDWRTVRLLLSLEDLPFPFISQLSLPSAVLHLIRRIIKAYFSAEQNISLQWGAGMDFQNNLILERSLLVPAMNPPSTPGG